MGRVRVLTFDSTERGQSVLTKGARERARESDREQRSSVTEEKSPSVRSDD